MPPQLSREGSTFKVLKINESPLINQIDGKDYIKLFGPDIDP